MELLKNMFIYSPGGENENNGSDTKSNESNSADSTQDKDKKKEKGFLDKVKEALQDWSNTDQEQTDFDDTRV